MYEKNRMFLKSNLAGFSHWEGALVADKLEVGTKLDIVTEFDNPYDPNAIALYFEGVKLGYIPRRLNPEMASLLYFNHNIFECVITQKDMSKDAESQISIAVFIKDNREKDTPEEFNFEVTDEKTYSELIEMLGILKDRLM